MRMLCHCAFHFSSTLLLGTDSIQMAKTLWRMPVLRAVAVAKNRVGWPQQEGSTEDIDSPDHRHGRSESDKRRLDFFKRPATPALGWLNF